MALSIDPTRGFHRAAALMVASLLGLLVLSTLDVQEASARSNRVDFTIAVAPLDDDEADSDRRVRRHREMAREAARRVELRLEAIDLKNSRVRLDDDHNIRITVYGRHSAQALKSALIPAGKLEVRPVIDDASPWLDIADSLPEGVELRSPAGTFQTDRLFLYAASPGELHDVLDRVSLGSTQVEIYPHDDGWRTINLGPSIAGEGDVESVEIERTPSGIPFVSISFGADAAQKARGQASSRQATHLAIVLDGEVVGLHRFNSRQFSETLALDPPDHLRSRQARQNWSIQVAGRLAAPIPIQLIELQE
jgi:hypothetical protein